MIIPFLSPLLVIMLFKFLFLVTVGKSLCVHFAPGTKQKDGSQAQKIEPEPNASEPDRFEGNEGDNKGFPRELSETELHKIVAEQPLDDPMNAFYDPYEPYRMSAFAYWRPITFPKEHANPPIPVGFLPLNAPPKSFPPDFFFHDDEARRIVLNEHAASFCPYLRKWREMHPMKPYPIGSNFLQNHPPIKFVPGTGYEIDLELAGLHFFSRKAEDEILKKAAREAEEIVSRPQSQTQSQSQSQSQAQTQTQAHSQSQSQTQQTIQGSVAEHDGPFEESSSEEENRESYRKRGKWLVNVLLQSIDFVQESRLDCRKFSSFLEIPPPPKFHLGAPLTCLEEVIFMMDELEDIYDPVESEDNIPEILNKPDHYRKILSAIAAGKMSTKKGKCPFGFKNPNKQKKSPPKKAQLSKTEIHKGTVPKWAKLKPGEEIFSSSEEAEDELIEKYRFSYTQVPFPSIQDTLKKYVSI